MNFLAEKLIIVWFMEAYFERLLMVGNVVLFIYHEL